MANPLTTGSLKFINPAGMILQALPHSPESAEEMGLGSLVLLFREISTLLRASNGRRCLLVIDDIAQFQWIGVGDHSLVRFLRAIHSVSVSVSDLVGLRVTIYIPNRGSQRRYSDITGLL